MNSDCKSCRWKQFFQMKEGLGNEWGCIHPQIATTASSGKTVGLALSLAHRSFCKGDLKEPIQR